jgi:uncharacterized protein
VFAVAVVMITATAAHALNVPPLTGRVVDLANVLSHAERTDLEARLAAYEQKTTQQFVVLTVPSLEGDPIEDFSIRVVEQWKLGKAKEDNGLLLVVVPKDRKMRIEVGYGLEGNITDALTSRIIRQILRPAFRQGAYGPGITTAIKALMQAGSGEVVDALPTQAAADDGGGMSPIIIVIIILLILFGPRFFFPFFLGIAWGGRGGGGWGSGGGGGFSGGGGGFGGGGASGDW